jgi:hypothetical protein
MNIEDDRKRRINAANDARRFLGSLDQIKDAAHREAATHDRIIEAVGNYCREHGELENCFTPTQVECLKDVCFHIAYIVDARNRAPPRGWKKVANDFRQVSWVVKLPVILGLLTFLGTACIGTYQLSAWLFKSAPATESLTGVPTPKK